MARGLLSAWPGVFYLREDQGGHSGGKNELASLEGLVRYKDGALTIILVGEEGDLGHLCNSPYFYFGYI